MWISVLEDEAVLNNLITKYLQKEGYSVRSYLRGEDAVQGLDKPTDLWVIDIMLPDIDGFTVFREVQRKNPNSYVIFISARNQDIDRLAGLELGGDDVLHQRRKEQRYQQTADGDKGAEFYRRPEGVEIVAVVKQRDEIIQADKLAGETKRIDAL